jgi:hypothetical protein
MGAWRFLLFKDVRMSPRWSHTTVNPIQSPSIVKLGRQKILSYIFFTEAGRQEIEFNSTSVSKILPTHVQ